MLKYVITFLLLMGLFFTACERDQVTDNPAECPDEVTYNADTRLILNSYCAYSGCHDGGRPSDFRTYSAMLPWLTQEQFVERVINVRDMPPGSDVTPGFEELSEEEITLLRCWQQAGYPEE